MSKKRAFVRYSKQGKIVPGSLILTAGSHPNGPSTWKEVPADLCCDNNNACGCNTDFPNIFGSTVPFVTLLFRYSSEPSCIEGESNAYTIYPCNGNLALSQTFPVILPAIDGYYYQENTGLFYIVQDGIIIGTSETSCD